MKLLIQLYKVYSPSRKEKKMRKFIKDYIRRNVPGAVVNQDKYGNLYVTKGECQTYPCIVAHMDQVQDEHSKDFIVAKVDDNLFGFSGGKCRMEGPGADDKNGVWVALRCLKKYDVMKAAFFMGEEIGCVGSSDADMEFFTDCRWVVQCDRKNGGDLITNACWCELCSKEFVAALQPERFGYKETEGMLTDVMTLKENGLKVSCVNMSCGYYRPHTDEEYTKWSELENCLNFVQWIIENVTDVYPHEYEEDKWAGCYKGGNYTGFGQYTANPHGKQTGRDYDTLYEEAYFMAYDMICETPGIDETSLYEYIKRYYPELKDIDINEVVGYALTDWDVEMAKASDDDEVF